MATNVPQKVRVNMMLNNGLDAEGNVQKLSESLGQLSLAGYDDDKALVVIDALQDVLEKEVIDIQKTLVSSVQGGE